MKKLELSGQELVEFTESVKSISDTDVKAFYKHGDKEIWKTEMTRRGLLKEKRTKPRDSK